MLGIAALGKLALCQLPVSGLITSGGVGLPSPEISPRKVRLREHKTWQQIQDDVAADIAGGIRPVRRQVPSSQRAVEPIWGNTSGLLGGAFGMEFPRAPQAAQQVLPPAVIPAPPSKFDIMVDRHRTMKNARRGSFEAMMNRYKQRDR